MFKSKKPAKKFVDGRGTEWTPIATLKDEHNGVCHVVIDDGCYVAYLYNEASGFVPTHYIFPELHKELSEMPAPESDTNAD
jgi:hypothetical protein